MRLSFVSTFLCKFYKSLKNQNYQCQDSLSQKRQRHGDLNLQQLQCLSNSFFGLITNKYKSSVLLYVEFTGKQTQVMRKEFPCHGVIMANLSKECTYLVDDRTCLKVPSKLDDFKWYLLCRRLPCPMRELQRKSKSLMFRSGGKGRARRVNQMPWSADKY